VAYNDSISADLVIWVQFKKLKIQSNFRLFREPLSSSNDIGVERPQTDNSVAFLTENVAEESTKRGRLSLIFCGRPPKRAAERKNPIPIFNRFAFGRYEMKQPINQLHGCQCIPVRIQSQTLGKKNPQPTALRQASERPHYANDSVRKVPLAAQQVDDSKCPFWQRPFECIHQLWPSLPHVKNPDDRDVWLFSSAKPPKLADNSVKNKTRPQRRKMADSGRFHCGN
jgi:hypothetical protein